MIKTLLVASIVITLFSKFSNAESISSEIVKFCAQEKADLAVAIDHLERGVKSQYWIEYKRARLENLKFCQSINSLVNEEKIEPSLSSVSFSEASN